MTTRKSWLVQSPFPTSQIFRGQATWRQTRFERRQKSWDAVSVKLELWLLAIFYWGVSICVSFFGLTERLSFCFKNFETSLRLSRPWYWNFIEHLPSLTQVGYTFSSCSQCSTQERVHKSGPLISGDGCAVWRSMRFNPWQQVITTYTGWWFGAFFPYIGNNNPNWRTHIFRRARYTTNEYTIQDPLVACGLIENHVFSLIRATILLVVGFVYRWLQVTVALPSGRNEVLHAMVTAMECFFHSNCHPKWYIRAQGYRHV